MGDLLLCLMFAAGLVWKGLPVSLWALAAGVLTWGTGLVAKRKARLPGAPILAGQLKGITLGLALVWLGQIAATAVGAIASDGTVRSGEEIVAAARASVSGPTVVAISIGLLALSLLLYRRFTATTALMSTIVASMLLFGWEAVRLAEARWVETRRFEASADLRAIRQAQSNLVALAEVRRRLAALSREEGEYLASFLRAAGSKKHRAEIIAEKAERLAADTEEPDPPATRGRGDVDWGAVERCAVWLGEVKADGAERAPSVRDLDTLRKVSADLQDRQSAARSSTGAFENAVAEAAARRWPRKAWECTVRDLPSAETVVAAQQGERWQLGVDGERRSGAAEADASELAFESLDGEATKPEDGDPSWSDREQRPP
jgi:hypothetical protein